MHHKQCYSPVERLTCKSVQTISNMQKEIHRPSLLIFYLKVISNLDSNAGLIPVSPTPVNTSDESMCEVKTTMSMNETSSTYISPHSLFGLPMTEAM